MFEDLDNLFDELFNGRKRLKTNNLNSFLNNLNLSSKKTKDDEPTSKKTFKINGFTFQESTWNSEHGKLVKVELVSTPFDILKPKNLSLDAQLEIAIKEERYEDAAKIRDEIKNGKPKMEQKEEVDSDNEWNF